LGEKLFKLFRPSYIVAYNGAKNLKSNAKGNDDDYINFAEFRVLNVYLCIYAGMLDAFSTIDGGGSGVTEDDDRRILKNEWLKGYLHVKTSGFVGLGKLKDNDAALAAFDVMDANNSGKVLFRDFCNYLSAAEVDAGTKMGFLFSGNGLQLRSFNTVEEPSRMSEPVDIDYTFAKTEEQGEEEEEEVNMGDIAVDDYHQEAEIDAVEDDLVENEVEEVHTEDDKVPDDYNHDEHVEVVADDFLNDNDEVAENEDHEQEIMEDDELDMTHEEEEENPIDDPEKNVLANGSLEEDPIEVDAAQ
jgi:hypothetical protein